MYTEMQVSYVNLRNDNRLQAEQECEQQMPM